MPHYRGFTITLRNTTLGSTPLPIAETSHLTTYNTHKTQTYMLLAGFDLTIPASERPQTHVLDRADTGTGLSSSCSYTWGGKVVKSKIQFTDQKKRSNTHHKALHIITALFYVYYITVREKILFVRTKLKLCLVIQNVFLTYSSPKKHNNLQLNNY